MVLGGFASKFGASHEYVHDSSASSVARLTQALCFPCLQRKYPEATDYAICSLIGGFFFLRFINPAIVTPQAYMLVEGVPAKFPRRTLTLVCRRSQVLFLV